MRLTLIRLAAALAVLLGHCYILTNASDAEPLMRITRGHWSLGEAAVLVFFALSGYLVTQSWLRDPSIARFMRRRALRIFPALIFVITASFLLGSMFSTLPPGAYFADPASWTYLAKILIYPPQYGLPGVFENNPYGPAVNGSLWSLRPEFALYLFVACAGRLGFLRRPFVMLVLGCLSAAGAVLFLTTGISAPLPFSHQITVLLLNAAPFFFGAALARRQGTREAKAPHRHIDDYSYGLYLWAFPVQQSLIALMPALMPLRLFAIAGIVSFIFAFISWHMIEKRALGFKPKSIDIK